MKSNMCIKVSFLAGTGIKEAIQEAKDKAILWDIAYTTFDFNGVGFSVSQKANICDLAEEYKSIGSSIKFIVG